MQLHYLWCSCITFGAAALPVVHLCSTHEAQNEEIKERNK